MYGIPPALFAPLVSAQQREAELLAGLSCHIDVQLLVWGEQNRWLGDRSCYPLVCAYDAHAPTHAVITLFAGYTQELHALPSPDGEFDLYTGLTPLIVRFALAFLDDEFDPLISLEPGDREPHRWHVALALHALGRFHLRPEAIEHYLVGGNFNMDCAGVLNGRAVSIRKQVVQVRHLLRKSLPCPGSSQKEKEKAMQELLRAAAAGLAWALLARQGWLRIPLNRARNKGWTSPQFRLVSVADFWQESAEFSAAGNLPKIPQ